MTSDANAEPHPHPLAHARELREAGRAAEAIPVLEDEEEAAEADDDAARVAEARWELALTYERLGEPEEQRYYLLRITGNERTPLGVRLRATGALRELENDADEEEGGDPLGVLAGVFIAIEVASLITGGILHAETQCVDDPMPCDHTPRDIGAAFFVVGSLWWLIPVAILVLPRGAPRPCVGSSDAAPARSGARALLTRVGG